MRLAAALAVLVATTPLAQADDWYGEQTLIADGATTALITTAVLIDGFENQRTTEQLALGGVAIFLFASPIVHLVHGEELGALGSLGTRVVVPLALGWLGDQLHGHRGVLAGIALGMLTSAAVDAAVFAYERDGDGMVQLSAGFPF